MNLRHQWAGRVDADEIARRRRRRHGFRHAMGGKNHRRRASGHLVEFIDEYGPLGPQRVDHVFVVHDFVAHIDRRAVFFERALDRVDGPHDAGAKTARRAQQQKKGRL